MKIIGIVGSYRNGNTLAMVNAASEAISSNAEVDIIQLNRIKISFCDGCLQCDETGECHIKDDMKEVIEKIKSADGFIIGTPTRWGLLSGELKTFFDRLNPLASSELLAGKKAIALAVGQSENNTDDAESIKTACDSIETFCQSADIEVIDKVCAYGFLEKNAIESDTSALNKCKKAAIKLLKAI